MTMLPPRPARIFRRGLLLLAAALAFAGPARAQALSPIVSYFEHWTDRVEEAQATQPKWITPLATTTPRLEQEFRYDQNHQSLKNGSTVDIFDNGKGLELIPTAKTEIIIPVPAYQVRRGTGPASGTTDWAGVLVKYRLLSANEASGNYVVSVFAQYGLPTGALVSTSRNHVFTPTLALGKGWGLFDLQATLAEAIPTHDNSNAGRAVLSNVTAQLHVATYFWPELELNRTDWSGGSRNERSQSYLTPGLVLGRFIIHGRSKFIVGLGYQTPVSKIYPANPATPTFRHNWILSARTTF
jgi:hypothetical protein